MRDTSGKLIEVILDSAGKIVGTKVLDGVTTGSGGRTGGGG